MAIVYLNTLAHGRSGDKGDTSNVCVFARDPRDYPFLKRVLTPQRVKAHFGDIVKGEVIRYDVDSLCGMNFVMKRALGGGATLSLRLDSLGKSIGSAFMRMKIDTDW
ncbi:MAG: AtuA-related protein [Bacillota bacterium]